ncbi:MAG: hypothetical protein LCI02_20305 [Proteobacteria bacterium]|nr:hypothetical protein [Pseudomonadota bacterium]
MPRSTGCILALGARRGAVLLAGLLMLAGCGAASAPAPTTHPGGALAEIEGLIGAAACRHDADCRVIGIGARACGGPEAYRAWSVIDTDERLLTERVQRDATVRRAEMDRLGVRSTCTMLPQPRVSCVLGASTASATTTAPGRCVLQSGRQAD